jgi:hypothetical protein
MTAASSRGSVSELLQRSAGILVPRIQDQRLAVVPDGIIRPAGQSVGFSQTVIGVRRRRWANTNRLCTRQLGVSSGGRADEPAVLELVEF